MGRNVKSRYAAEGQNGRQREEAGEKKNVLH